MIRAWDWGANFIEGSPISGCGGRVGTSGNICIISRVDDIGFRNSRSMNCFHSCRWLYKHISHSL